MGLNSHTLRLMAELRMGGQLKAGKVIEIGAQQLSDSFLRDRDGIAAISRAFGVPVPDLPAPLAEDDSGGLQPSAPLARPFYEALGFEYACVDIDGTPGAVSLDLNYDDAPSDLIGRFDLVTNFGTTEHIANQLNAFKITHDLAALGGIMIHELPSQGALNHGLVNYNPNFFWALARSNEYEWLFFDFRWGPVDNGVPENIMREIRRHIEPRGRPAFGASESCLLIALRKKHNHAFIPPMDVPRGALAPNAIMKQRYPTIYASSIAIHILDSGARSVKRSIVRLLRQFPHLRLNC